MWSHVAPIWEELGESAPASSPFLSKEWTECWLQTFGAALETSILVVNSGGLPVGAGLLVSSKRRKGVVPVRCICLNAAGEAPGDTTYIEYNDLLCRPGYEETVAATLVSHLKRQRWDEVALDGFRPGAGLDAFQRACAGLNAVLDSKPDYYVDLEQVRRRGGLDSVLGKTTRKHLRQNFRYYEQNGPLHVEGAGSLAQALSMLDRLAEMHQQRWQGQGYRGAFASARFRAFHRGLLERCDGQGKTLLLQVSAGQRIVGIVYTLLHRGKIYHYQSGFEYGDDKRWSPGMVTLYYVIQHCCDAGLREFDFLAGSEKYKQLLSTDSRELVWAVFRRPRLKFRLIEALRRMKMGIQQHV